MPKVYDIIKAAFAEAAMFGGGFFTLYKAMGQGEHFGRVVQTHAGVISLFVITYIVFKLIIFEARNHLRQKDLEQTRQKVRDRRNR